MFPMLTGFISYGQQTIRAARYIGQGFIITLSHTNRLPITIHYPYEKSITSERFRGRIHFEFDKCIACEVCVRVCPLSRDIYRLGHRFDFFRMLSCYFTTVTVQLVVMYIFSCSCLNGVNEVGCITNPTG